MSTHWHAIVDVPDGSLSVGMQTLTGEYSKRFNARHGRVGYLVRDRFWSRRKETAAEVLDAYAYLANNPKKAGATRRPEDWFWSSYATTLGLADTFPLIDDRIVLGELGGTITQARQRLRRFVDSR